ncbi:MAG TPA: hypothetical protein VJ821_18390 [Anaerolineales bacterium]|nr:hypothetical protein [Anaerolineales bacterium]
MRKHLYRSCFVLIGILIASLALPSKAFAQSGDLTPNPAAEQWVLEQIALGNIANLQNQFPNEEDRVLRGDFMVELLENPAIEIPRYGIDIRNAVFDGPLDLQYLTVDYPLWLVDCKFNDGLYLYQSHFTRDLYLRGSTFSAVVDLAFSKIDGNLVADDAKFLDVEQGADFNSIRVDGLVALQEAEFAGPVDFIGAQIGITFDAEGASFNNKEESAVFDSMRVNGGVFLQGAKFWGPVSFIAARVESTFDARESSFKNKENPAIFNSMIVGGSLFLQNVEFAGAVNFAYTQIGRSFEANKAHFQNKERPASFNSMKVNGPVFLTEAEFEGPVDFIRAQIGSNLAANDVRFNNQDNDKQVEFESMKVEGHVFLNRTVFAGPVSFRFVEIQNNFDASNAEFQSKDSGPNFNNMIVRQAATFVGTKFQKDADFNNAVFLDLIILGEASAPIQISDLHLSQTLIERELYLESVEIQNLYSGSLVVRGLTNIRKVSFLNSADFENSQFGNLYVENVNWPEGLANINLGGMSYQNIEMILEADGDAWEELIELVDRSAYNAQAYTTLENYFLQQGYADRADEVYIAYKKREFKEALSRFSMGWWSNLFLWSVGYGRKPGFVLIGALLFIIVGWLFVFRKPEGMVSLSKHEIIGPKVGNHGTLSRKIPMRVISSQHEIPYNPFWYSLDLFIPFIDLGFDDKWSPRPNRKWAIAYAKLHMLAGWVLLPIGLLAITGVIK